jgi:predicted unusual protein kinase regulating ubiquinone biosynthesis (AarF/ABC1/UbiB family)
MAAVFEALDPEALRANTPEVVRAVMETVRRHRVHIRGVVSTILMTSLVLEGWYSELDPEIRVLKTVRAQLPEARARRLGASLEALMASTSTSLAQA